MVVVSLFLLPYFDCSNSGLTNTVTAVKNAQMAETAVVIIAGAAPNLSKGCGALQVIIYSPTYAWSVSVENVSKLFQCLSRIGCGYLTPRLWLYTAAYRHPNDTNDQIVVLFFRFHICQ